MKYKLGDNISETIKSDYGDTMITALISKVDKDDVFLSAKGLPDIIITKNELKCRFNIEVE